MAESDLGKVGTDPLFLGLTRPALMFGVSFMYFGLNVMGAVMYFVAMSDFKIFPVALLVHVFGMGLNKKEPLAVEILMTKMQKCNKCRNRIFYGGLNSYGIF